MRRIILVAFLMIVVTMPLLTASNASGLAPPLTPPHRSQGVRNALILSSLNLVIPTGYYGTLMQQYLSQAGYQVTVLNDGNVTLDVLLNQLNNYQIIIWRTSVYNYKHKEYWYVGQVANSVTFQQYQSDFAQGWINSNAGILGVSWDFFANHFSQGSLTNVKLFIMISTDSNSIAPYLSNAQAQAVVFCNGAISLEFGYVDDFTGALLAYLGMGETVNQAVYNLVSPYARPDLRDPLDSWYAPPFWYMGNGTLTIT